MATVPTTGNEDILNSPENAAVYAALHDRLTALGAPPVDLQSLQRLHQGPFGNALEFVASHVRGRGETQKARATIQAYAVTQVSSLPHRQLSNASQATWTQGREVPTGDFNDR